MDPHQYAPTAIMIITRTPARRTATTGRNGLLVTCSSARAPGFTDFMGARAFMDAASTVVDTMAAGFTDAAVSAAVAGTMTVFVAEDSRMKALNTVGASMVEAGFTAVAGFPAGGGVPAGGAG